MRVIITGASGQLGQALQKVLSQQDFDIINIPRLNIEDHTTVQTLADYRPELVIHAAAMSDVDGCAQRS